MPFYQFYYKQSYNTDTTVANKENDNPNSGTNTDAQTNASSGE